MRVFFVNETRLFTTPFAGKSRDTHTTRAYGTVFRLRLGGGGRGGSGRGVLACTWANGSSAAASAGAASVAAASSCVRFAPEAAGGADRPPRPFTPTLYQLIEWRHRPSSRAPRPRPARPRTRRSASKPGTCRLHSFSGPSGWAAGWRCASAGQPRAGQLAEQLFSHLELSRWPCHRAASTGPAFPCRAAARPGAPRPAPRPACPARARRCAPPALAADGSS